MTRQKKEIIKKIEEIEIFIATDEELGCGFAPAGAYDDLYKKIDELQEQLAKLQHYGSVEEMMLDLRGISPAEMDYFEGRTHFMG